MNVKDEMALTDFWHSETTALNNGIDYSFKEAQNHAYELGFKRGIGDMKQLAKRIKKANDENDQKEWVALHNEIYRLAED